MQKQHLTPPGMPNNEIGAPTIEFELKSRRRSRFASNQLGFGIMGPRVGIKAGTPLGLPLLQDNSLGGVWQAFFSLPEGLHAVVALGQGRCQVFELPGKVLMNKENVQALHLADA
jgi:hypothetical protein